MKLLDMMWMVGGLCVVVGVALSLHTISNIRKVEASTIPADAVVAPRFQLLRRSPGLNQPSIWVSELHDMTTGVDYLIVQDYHAISVVQLAPKKLEER